jgi:hypothetical protein
MTPAFAKRQMGLASQGRWKTSHRTEAIRYSPLSGIGPDCADS